MKPTKCPAREKKMRQEKRKVKVKTAVSLLNPKTMSKFCFLRMPELRKLIFCIWIRRPPSVRPVNRFVVSFSSLQHDSDQKTTQLASKRVLKGQPLSPAANGLSTYVYTSSKNCIQTFLSTEMHGTSNSKATLWGIHNNYTSQEFHEIYVDP